MFKQLSRSNQVFYTTHRNAWVGGVNCVRDRSTDDPRQSLAKAFAYLQQRTRMDIEQKMKELADLFSKTGKELTEIVKRNEEFITEEIRRAEETIRNTSEECSKQHMNRLRTVKDAYAERMKTCNDKAAVGLRNAKEQFETQLGKTDVLHNTMKQMVRECLDTDEFVKCIGNKMKEAAIQRKETVSRLNDTIMNAQIILAEHLKEAMKCHAEAQAESLKSLAEILKDTKNCLSQN